MKTIEELKEIWNNDKEAFKSKELGGLQSFVANVLNKTFFEEYFKEENC